jgi:lipoyl(octanoyl) transferase
MIVEDLKLMGYREAWERQECAHEEVVAGGEERLMLVEHPAGDYVWAAGGGGGEEFDCVAERLAEMGVEVVESDRGGDITFHGPGQLVVYPIVRLNDHGLSVGGYVRRLEEVMIRCLAELGVEAKKDERRLGFGWRGRRFVRWG